MAPWLLAQIITLSDLECDYINARACCSKLNKVGLLHTCIYMYIHIPELFSVLSLVFVCFDCDLFAKAYFHVFVLLMTETWELYNYCDVWFLNVMFDILCFQWVIPEMVGQCLSTMLMLVSMHWFIFLLNLPVAAWNIYRYPASNRCHLDVSSW